MPELNCSAMSMSGRSAPAALASPRNRGLPLLMAYNAATHHSCRSELRAPSSDRMADAAATAPASISAARPSAQAATLQTSMSASRRMAAGSAASDATASRFLGAPGARAILDWFTVASERWYSAIPASWRARGAWSRSRPARTARSGGTAPSTPTAARLPSWSARPKSAPAACSQASGGEPGDASTSTSAGTAPARTMGTLFSRSSERFASAAAASARAAAVWRDDSSTRLSAASSRGAQSARRLAAPSRVARRSAAIAASTSRSSPAATAVATTSSSASGTRAGSSSFSFSFTAPFTRVTSTSTAAISLDDLPDDEDDVDAANAPSDEHERFDADLAGAAGAPSDKQDRFDDDLTGGCDCVPAGTARSTAALASSAEGGAGAARPERAHHVRTAARSASLGMATGTPPPPDAFLSPGGTTPSEPRERPRCAQACTHARSYVLPDGRMTGSAIGAPRIGHRNSAGTSSPFAFLAGDGGTGMSGGRSLGRDRDRKGSSFQRRARSAPICLRRVASRRRRRSFSAAKQRRLLLEQRQ
ncbi:hypothetical protein U9M48_038954 [Paspalum notatum var. saurae]|uniref:Uncharacterized protein n=1 Tax=Paspalum notatum var. saurae TaxID=547442 RepID=A0AAQ3UIJ7_PASNO